MSLLVDEHGQPLSSVEEQVCPKCGSTGKDHETIKAFGGYRTLVCQRCRTVLKRWRESHEEV
jgi:uncharacterized Zn finger protein